MVLDLRLGQRRLFNGRPHHGFRALIKRAVHQELHEFLGDHPLGMEIHRQVRLGPVARHAKPLKLVALDVDPTRRKLTALGAELVDRHLVLVLALLAVLLLDLPLDGQAVTVPSGDVARIKAHHLVAAYDHILDRLVERVPDVQMPVRIGRSVVQREGRASLFFAQAVINSDPLPTRQPVGLALGQASTHREFRARQAQGVFVI